METEQILHLVTQGDCTFTGFGQVHFKAPKAHVSITDPHLTGIFHIIEGEVRVSYHASSYGEVIKVKAPMVNVSNQFVHRDGLFIPERFATQNWWRKKPALDISLGQGTVILELETSYVGYRIPPHDLNDFIKPDTLGYNKNIIEKGNLDEIINKNKKYY